MLACLFASRISEEAIAKESSISQCELIYTIAVDRFIKAHLSKLFSLRVLPPALQITRALDSSDQADLKKISIF
jgi:hypothetical protein